MESHSPRFWELFFEVFENLPRQGPGSKTCAAEALALCRELPESPSILDLGCGVGGQTLYLAALRDCGFEPVGHFPLPDEAWWDDFYTPMTQRINVLRQQHAGDAEAAAILDQLAKEPELHRRFGHHYAYEFFVARKAPAGGAGGD